jgi:hypothetical protein
MYEMQGPRVPDDRASGCPEGPVLAERALEPVALVVCFGFPRRRRVEVSLNLPRSPGAGHRVGGEEISMCC